jgi:hypothetical protein
MPSRRRGVGRRLKPDTWLAAHDDGLAAQIWKITLLHGGEERIHVEE